MTINITEEEIISIEKVLEMFLDVEYEHLESYLDDEEDPDDTKIEAANSNHIYYSLRTLQQMVNKLKEGK